MNQIVLANQDTCTGCGACANVCPKNAISMKPDYEGFIQPVIDEAMCIQCKLCEKTCPVINPKKVNSMAQDVFAVRASDEIRSVSSSGGVFTLVANWVLEQNGVVCGAAFDSEFHLRHIAVERKEDLAPLRGSKYLQSDPVDIYMQVKNFLAQDKVVLYVGTPCQVAALYRITGQHKNLYTIDILCHGVPSQDIFSRYLTEISAGRKVTDVKFRDKRFGWVANYIRIEFSDGSFYEGSDKTDAYEKGFLRNVWLRRSCESCQFSEYPREGDMTIGDFWGITKVDADQNDGKGTSVVLVNNERGAMLYHKVLKVQANCEKVNILPTKLPNRVHAGCVFNKNRDRFFRLKEQKGVIESVDRVLSGKYDIGLVSNYCAENFGGAITHYALYHTLENMGYSVLMIESPLGELAEKVDSRLPAMLRCFNECLYPDYAMSKFYKTKAGMRELNNFCDTFVVGSDQLYQYVLYTKMSKFASLDFVEDRKKKISVAASFGHGKVWGDPKVHAELSYWLNKFDAFSVREADAVDICKETYGIDAKHVLDPVFLVDPKYYDALADKSKEILPHTFVGFYILDPNEQKQKIITETAGVLHYNMAGFSEFNASEKYLKPLEQCNVKNYKGEDRVKILRDCDFLVTDSFHGTCFAIIMKKPFVSFVNHDRGGSRFYSLLGMLGLEDRLVESYGDFNQKIDMLKREIDWDAVYKKLNERRDDTLNWLCAALKSDKLNRSSTYDLLSRRIYELDHRLSEEIKQRKLLQKQLSTIDSQALSESVKTIPEPEVQNKEASIIERGMNYYKRYGLRATVKRIVYKEHK